jgi:hypothetical protein
LGKAIRYSDKIAKCCHGRRRPLAQEEFEPGDKVEWNTPQGKTRGTVKKKLTSRT